MLISAASINPVGPVGQRGRGTDMHGPKAGRERAVGVMDRTFEGGKTRRIARDRGMTPVAPSRANRKNKWDHDRELYKLRNEVEQLFRRLKGCRRIYTRFDKLDAMFLASLNFDLVVERIYELA